MTRPILITGATGRVGGALARLLTARGEPVRVLSRAPSADPAQVTGDLEDPASIERAAAGARSAFVYARGTRPAEIARALRRAGVERAVVLSTIDATNPHAYAAANRARHLAFEDAIAATGVQWTFLRPGAFASNALRFWGASIAAESVVRVPFPEAAQAPIDERDIAAVAARALLGDDLVGRALVLTGPASLTQRAQVAIISDVVRRPLRIDVISPAEARAALAAIVPPAYVDLLLAQWEDEVGRRAEVTDEVARVLGRRPTAYADWVAVHRARFAEA